MTQDKILLSKALNRFYDGMKIKRPLVPVPVSHIWIPKKIPVIGGGPLESLLLNILH